MARLSQNATNQESWLYVLQVYAGYPDTPYWNQWRSILVPVTERGIEAGYNQLFRADTSMQRTTFSTGDRDVLRFNPSARFRHIAYRFSLRLGSRAALYKATGSKSASSRGRGKARSTGQIGYWLLAIGYWLSAIGYRLSAIGYSRGEPPDSRIHRNDRNHESEAAQDLRCR
jgi:hypothetical protein